MRVGMLLAGLLLSTTALVGAQSKHDPYKNIPKGHWAYDAVEGLAASGITTSQASHWNRGRTLTPYEFAVQADRSLKLVRQRIREGKRLSFEQASALRRLCAEFRFELAEMGQSEEMVASLLSEAEGQKALDIFKDVPKTHWAYDALVSLSGPGGPIPYVPWDRRQGFGNSRPITHYEMGVFIHRSLVGAQKRAQEGKPLTPSQALTFTKLCEEFKSELEVLGQSRQAVSALIVEASGAQEPPEMFRDVPKSHWSYDALNSLIDSGFPVPTPSHGLKGRILTPYEFAVILDRSLITIREEFRASKRLTPAQATTILRLYKEYGKELQDMRRPAWTEDSVVGVLNQAQGVTGFKDVPPDHWAYKAVDDLRKKGILRGYPDGRFRGGSH
jgi:hypothetical protein